MEIDDKREVVTGRLGQTRQHHAGRSHRDPATREGLVERTHGHPSRKGPKPRGGARHLPEATVGEEVSAEAVPPVVEVAYDQRRVVLGLAKQKVAEKPAHLPAAFALGEAEMRVDEMEGALR